jgi:hypothetical protein
MGYTIRMTTKQSKTNSRFHKALPRACEFYYINHNCHTNILKQFIYTILLLLLVCHILESTIWVFMIFLESIAGMETMQLLQSSLVIILTPYNYFEWNSKSAFQLKRKGLYNLMMATETEPTSTLEKTKWEKLKDEVIGLLLELISIDLWFHVTT